MRGVGFSAAVGLQAGALLAVAFGVSPAQAAVRQCTERPTVTVGEDAASEAAARKQALDRWVSEAAKLGVQWTSWRLAVSRDFKCERRAEGGFACRVVGAPCAIVQNPAKPPKFEPDTKPPKPQQDI